MRYYKSKDLHSKAGLSLACITSVAREALTQPLVSVADSSIGALSDVLIVACLVREELVDVKVQRVVWLDGIISSPVGGKVCLDDVSTKSLMDVLGKSGEGICRVGLVLLCPDLLNSVKVNVRRVAGEVVKSKEGNDIRLVQAVVNVLKLVTVVIIDLARNITIERYPTLMVLPGCVSHDNFLRSESKVCLGLVGRTSEHTLSRVHLEHVTLVLIRTADGIKEVKVSSVVV
mmetsp:Transcript_25994/g.38495  ORF Transcript_25994/g.38495 Transcript_25994/m.38495 type:complete len:231 (+) Transcript_25994:77-769(+)